MQEKINARASKSAPSGRLLHQASGTDNELNKTEQKRKPRSFAQRSSPRRNADEPIIRWSGRFARAPFPARPGHQPPPAPVQPQPQAQAAQTSAEGSKSVSEGIACRFTGKARTNEGAPLAARLTFGPRKSPYGTPSNLSMWCICSRNIAEGAHQPHDGTSVQKQKRAVKISAQQVGIYWPVSSTVDGCYRSFETVEGKVVSEREVGSLLASSPSCVPCERQPLGGSRARWRWGRPGSGGGPGRRGRTCMPCRTA